MKKRLPSEKEFQLMALAIKERSGRDIAKHYQEQTGKTISYGTLYTTFRRLRDDTGWVRYRDQRSGDGRVRLIKLSGKGVQALNEARKAYRSLSTFGLSTGRAHG